MTRKLVGAVVSIAVALTGCATQASQGAPTLASHVTMPTATSGSATLETTTNDAVALTTTNVAPMPDLQTLPTAPWSAPPMSANEAPRQILSAWENADNRDS